MPTSTDSSLLVRIKADEKSALQELFNQQYMPVCNAIVRLVRDKALAQDLGQEVFIKFWEKRHQLEIKSSLPAYLRRMAINEAISHLRKYQKMRSEEFIPERYNATTISSEDVFIGAELKERVKVAIDTLPPRCRLIFQLSRFEELTYKEIAARLDLSVKTIENQMGKALRILRERLQSDLRFWPLIALALTQWLEL